MFIKFDINKIKESISNFLFKQPEELNLMDEEMAQQAQDVITNPNWVNNREKLREQFSIPARVEPQPEEPKNNVVHIRTGIKPEPQPVWVPVTTFHQFVVSADGEFCKIDLEPHAIVVRRVSDKKYYIEVIRATTTDPYDFTPKKEVPITHIAIAKWHEFGFPGSPGMPFVIDIAGEKLYVKHLAESLLAQVEGGGISAYQEVAATTTQE